MAPRVAGLEIFRRYGERPALTFVNLPHPVDRFMDELLILHFSGACVTNPNFYLYLVLGRPAVCDDDFRFLFLFSTASPFRRLRWFHPLHFI